MTEQEIQEGEKLLARFMSFKQEFKDEGRWDVDGNGFYKVTTDGLGFSRSWDRLIKALHELSGNKSPLIIFSPDDILTEFELCVERIKRRNKALKQLNENSNN